MARVLKRITLKKAVQSFVLYGGAVGGVLATVEIPEGDLTDKALITLGVGTIAAIVRAINNVRKTRKAPRSNGYGGYMYLAALGLAGLLAGCVTTTAPDGTVTTGVDPVALDTAWAAWQRLETRRAELERQRDDADARERAALEAELRRLEPELRAAAERLGF